MKRFSVITLTTTALLGGCALNPSTNENQVASEFGQKALDVTIKQDTMGHPAELLFSAFSDSSDILARDDYLRVNIKNQQTGRFDAKPLEDLCEYRRYQWFSLGQWSFCLNGEKVELSNKVYTTQVGTGPTGKFFYADTLVPLAGQKSESLQRSYSNFRKDYDQNQAQKRRGQNVLNNLRQEYFKMVKDTGLVEKEVLVGQRVCLFNRELEVIFGFVEMVGENIKFKPQYKYDYFLSGINAGSKQMLRESAVWMPRKDLNFCPSVY